MEVKATSKFMRISPLKARDVAREIKGLPVSQAIDILSFTPRKAAVMVGKTLKSAIANAENNHELAVDSLVVKEAAVGDGPALRRYKPRARGSAGPIRKRMSHIYITLTDEIELPAPKKKSSVTRKKKIEKRLAMAGAMVKKAKKKAAAKKEEEAGAEAKAEETEVKAEEAEAPAAEAKEEIKEETKEEAAPEGGGEEEKE